MPTPALPKAEAESRLVLIEQCLQEGFVPVGHPPCNGKRGALREAYFRANEGREVSGGASHNWYLAAKKNAGRDADWSLWAGGYDSPGRAPMAGEVPDGFRMKGRSTLYRGNGSVAMEWVKTTADQERQHEMAREAVNAWMDDMPAYRPVTPGTHETNAALMSVIPFGDPHFGLYCWAEEVGADFNLDIAERDLCAAVEYLVANGPPSERCVIVNLGDFFHADNLAGITSRSGNVLDMDTRLPKIIRVGVRAMRHCIATALAKHKTVEVINAIGNHDDVLSLALSIMLANVYEAEPRIIIHDQPTRRHYIQHGKVLIGVTHGDQTKDRDLPGIMATERPSEWGEARHRYWYRGHHHHASLDEYPGCKVEQFRTLAPGDAYAVGHGYLSGRDMQLIVHHAEYGERARSTCSIDMLRGHAT